MSVTRRLVMRYYVRGDLTRHASVLVAAFVWRRLRRGMRREPEQLYRAALGPGHRLGLLTARPLPGYLVDRALKRRVAAMARADLEAESGMAS